MTIEVDTEGWCTEPIDLGPRDPDKCPRGRDDGMILDGHGIENLRVLISQAYELASELVICPSADG